MDSETKDLFQKEIIKALHEYFKAIQPELKFNKTLWGRVVSYSGGIAKVLINEINYDCVCKKSVSSGNNVRVIAPNNDYSKLYVDEVV